MDIETIKNIYQHIRRGLIKEDVKVFWDQFFKHHAHLYKYLFMDGICTPSLYDVDFLEKEKYYATKERVHLDVSFNLIGVYKLFKLEEKYDFINLSNIMNYDLNKINYAYLVKKLIDNNLEENGVILANYDWKNAEKTLEFLALDQAKCNPKILRLEKKYKKQPDDDSVILCSK